MSLTRICLRKIFALVLVHTVMSSLPTLSKQGSGGTYGDSTAQGVGGTCYFWDALGNKIGTTIESDENESVRYYVSKNYSAKCGAGSTLIEWTYNAGKTYYDISCVDGYSCAVSSLCNNDTVYFSHLDSSVDECNSKRNECGECVSGCISTNEDAECCRNSYNSVTCKPQWSVWLHDTYASKFNGIYTYAYDDKAGLHICAGRVEFSTLPKFSLLYPGATYTVSEAKRTCTNTVDRFIVVIAIGILKEVLTFGTDLLFK
uniref:28 kDa protein n=1 Tax=Persimmon virus B TaxID=1493829 RepID=A0A0A8JCA9_9CLOS|nr:28 kDa protein [Persimmon virus B]